MSVDSTKLIIPGKGTVFYAPAGTRPPTIPLGATGFDLLRDGPGSWRNLGHTSKNNTIAFTKEGGEVETIDTFLADAVRTTTSGVTWGMTIPALQFDQDNLSLAFNGAFDTSTGGYIVASPAPVNVALFVYFKDTTGALGFWIPSVDISVGDAPSVDTANFFELPLTATFLSAGSNVMPSVNGRAGLFQIFKSGLTSLEHALVISGTPAGGDYKLRVNGKDTASIAYNAANTAVASAINAITGTPTATVTGAAPNYTVTFASPGAALAVAANGLTGGTNPAVSVQSS